MHGTVAIHVEVALAGGIDGPFAGDGACGFPGFHGCGAARNGEAVFPLEIRPGARVRRPYHDAVGDTAMVGLAELHAYSIECVLAAEVLVSAGIVLQLPGDRAVRFSLVASGDRVAQQESGEFDGGGAAHLTAVAKGDSP